jgi:2-methylcitrate dehydratase PrpD
MSTTIEQLAGFASATAFADLPASVAAEAKRLLLDSIGCALAGVNSEKGRWALDFARSFHAGPAQASLIGLGDRLSVPGAAFVNGETINGLDYDAGAKPGHTPPFVIPTVLAVAEFRAASGKDLILACALAHELSGRIGGAMSSFRDIHQDTVSWPLVAGYSACIFGATAAAAKLDGLTEERLAHALGLAGHLAPVQTQSAWINNLPATTAKYLMAGWINQAAVSAAYLAKAGHRGNLGVLDGDYGFWRFAGSPKWNGEAVVSGLGHDWRFARETTYKQYPICRIMHGALDGLAALIGQHGLEPQEIESIRAYLEASCVQPVFGVRDIQQQIDAQFSVPYGLAVMALGIPPGPRWQDASIMHSAAVHDLMRRVSFEPHPGYVAALKRNPKARLSKVEVRARGKLFVAEQEFIRGTQTDDAATALTDDELLQKFRRNAAEVLPADRIAQAEQALTTLEDIGDVGTLLTLLRP